MSRIDNTRGVRIMPETHDKLVELCRQHGYKIQHIADWVIKEWLSTQEQQQQYRPCDAGGPPERNHNNRSVYDVQ